MGLPASITVREKDMSEYNGGGTMNITCTWRFDVVAADPTTIPPEVDRIMERLLLSEDAVLHDAAVGLDLGKMSVEISISVRASSIEDGLARGMAAIQNAIRDAGGTLTDAPDAQPVAPSGVEWRHGQLTAA